jgi:hypothetical protein
LHEVQSLTCVCSLADRRLCLSAPLPSK